MPSKKTSQVDKFKQAARELETDDSEKSFNEKLGEIARQKPSEKIRREKRPGNRPDLRFSRPYRRLLLSRGLVSTTSRHLPPGGNMHFANPMPCIRQINRSS
jgi:hypothetical protein